MSKYYTPKIEEFHVGFEVQLLDPAYNEWIDFVVGSKFKDPGLWFFNSNKCRVKYLDIKDIESLGFMSIDEPQALSLEDAYERDGVVIRYSPPFSTYKGIVKIGYRNLIRDASGRYDGFSTNFKGELKNKSELKRVLKQIGI